MLYHVISHYAVLCYCAALCYILFTRCGCPNMSFKEPLGQGQGALWMKHLNSFEVGAAGGVVMLWDFCSIKNRLGRWQRCISVCMEKCFNAAAWGTGGKLEKSQGGSFTNIQTPAIWSTSSGLFSLKKASISNYEGRETKKALDLEVYLLLGGCG